jgi:hypothetical protein
MGHSEISTVCRGRNGVRCTRWSLVTRIRHGNSQVHVHMPATILLSQSRNVIAKAGFRVYAKSDAVKILAGTSSPVAGFITTAIHEPTVRANYLTYHHHYAKLTERRFRWRSRTGNGFTCRTAFYYRRCYLEEAFDSIPESCQPIVGLMQGIY